MTPGEVVDVLGFASIEGESTVLKEAVFRSVSPGAPVPAVPSTAQEALDGKHNSELIQIGGQLIGRIMSSSDTTLLLTDGKNIFTAVLPRDQAGQDANKWEIGSRVQVTGIWSVQLDIKSSAVGEGIAVA